MKLIQIHPDSAFLAFPQMSVHRNDNEIYFGFAGMTQFQFNSLNCYTAMECYAYVVSCLGDPDSQSCDLPYREEIYAACWKDAATVAPLMLALQAKVNEDCSFAEVKPFKDAVLPYNQYCNSDGVALHWGKLLMKFYEIQSKAQ